MSFCSTSLLVEKKTDMSVLDKDEQFTQFFIRYQDRPFCVE